MILMLAATFGGVMTIIGYILLALLCLVFMVVIHELGHYAAGKILGFKINEFGIGFGPVIFRRVNKKNGEVFSLRLLPLGGFCQFEGEEGESEEKVPGAFNDQAPWKRLIVLFSGAFFNFLSAILLISLVFTFFGQLLPTVAYVSEESAVYADGTLQSGDAILRIDGKIVNIVMIDDYNKHLSGLDSDTEELIIVRDGKRMKTVIDKSAVYERDEENNILLDESGNPTVKRAFGFTLGLSYVKLDFFTAFSRSFSFSFYLVYKILWLIGQLLTGALAFSQSAGGPVTVVKTIYEAGRTGYGTLMYVVCIISANLAVMNLLPLPALDGSKMVFTIIEWIRGKPVNRKVENIIHLVGFFALFVLAISADLMHFLS